MSCELFSLPLGEDWIESSLLIELFAAVDDDAHPALLGRVELEGSFYLHLAASGRTSPRRERKPSISLSLSLSLSLGGSCAARRG